VPTQVTEVEAGFEWDPSFDQRHRRCSVGAATGALTSRK
jgi:hypothetical protein